MNNSTHPIEAQRLENQRTERKDWRLGGPCLAQQARDTVGADDRPEDTAWEPFDHAQARPRAYPWSEDGLEGLCENQQRPDWQSDDCAVGGTPASNRGGVSRNTVPTDTLPATPANSQR